MARKVWLCNLVIFALLIGVDFAAGIDVAICTVSHPMPQNDADQEIDVLRGAIQGAVDLQLFGAGDLMLWQIGYKGIPAARIIYSY